MYKSREGRGYPANFKSLLAHFKCEICAITRGARTYRTSKHVQEKGYHTKRKQDSEDILAPMTACSPLECPDCDPSEGGFKTFLVRLHAWPVPVNQRRRGGGCPRRPKALSLPLLLKPLPLTWLSRHLVWCTPLSTACTWIMLTIIILGRNKELYYLIIVIDSIDLTRAQPSPNRSEPEDLIHDFMTLTGIKVGHIRADGAGEFARSAIFKAYCRRHNIIIKEVPVYTHTFTARAEGAIRICKDKVSAFLRRANMPRRFWPDALLHWCRTYAHWPDASGHTAWEKLDELGPHSLCHDLERDRHVFGSYVTGHLPREHPHVADTTHDDRAEKGVFLGNDLTTPKFWLWSFKHKKAMQMSDPKHFDHILPFLQPADVHHTLPLTAQEVVRMHAKGDVPVAVRAAD
jgi:hypothetical protein